METVYGWLGPGISIDLAQDSSITINPVFSV